MHRSETDVGDIGHAMNKLDNGSVLSIEKTESKDDIEFIFSSNLSCSFRYVCKYILNESVI